MKLLCIGLTVVVVVGLVSIVLTWAAGQARRWLASRQLVHP